MIVVLVCELCKQEFREEATVSTRGGYREPNRDFSVIYCGSHRGLELNCVCPSCLGALNTVLDTEVTRLKAGTQ
jgi:hypothetical protein